MNDKLLRKLFVCPSCKRPLNTTRNKCSGCGHQYQNSNQIWDFILDTKSVPLTGYEEMHSEGSFGKINDGIYDILSLIARGNKTLDIACGDGYIEELAPETVGLEFSLNALIKAKKRGAKHLVRADAHSLPFKDNSFDVVICAGSFEHFKKPLKALKEMARVSKIQVLTIHKKFPIPLANTLRSFILRVKNIADQPIDNPLDRDEIERLFKKAGLKIIFSGVWNYPYNLEFLGISGIEKVKIPSCHFVISIKNERLSEKGREI